MLYPVERLLPSFGKVITVTHQETVRDALTKMVTNDFSQLPIVDENGHLTGMISEQSISRTYYHVSEQVSLFDLTVDHCQIKAITLTLETDIFEALDHLQNTNAIVVIEGKKPVGILTFFDATHFFRELTEGLILVEDIETTLRKYIEAVCDNDTKMNQALINAFGKDDKDEQLPRRNYEDMSFYHHIQFIITGKNWPLFESSFKPRTLFEHLMGKVREIRNQLMHFRGEISTIDFDALERSREWLVSRPKQMPKDLTIVQSVPQHMENDQLLDEEPSGITGKYRPLYLWLKEQEGEHKNLSITFEQIEKILGESLPPTARTHQSWWANDSVGHRQSQAWLRAGWRVSEYDLAAGTVTFQQTNTVLYQFFFSDTLELLKERRPGITQATKTWVKSSWYFSAGRSGFVFGWAFDSKGRFRTNLYIDTNDADKNLRAFDWLHSQKKEIEIQARTKLLWDRLDEHRASRILIERDGTITDSPERLAEIKEWAVESMIAMVDTFRPLIPKVPLE